MNGEKITRQFHKLLDNLQFHLTCFFLRVIHSNVVDTISIALVVMRTLKMVRKTTFIVFAAIQEMEEIIALLKDIAKLVLFVTPFDKRCER